MVAHFRLFGVMLDHTTQPKASAGTSDDFPDLLSTEFEEVVSQPTQEHRPKVYSRSRDLEKGRTKRCLGGLSFG